MIGPRMNRKTPGSHAASRVLSTLDLNRALLARQMLLGRRKISAANAVEHLVGMQSQLPNSPYVGLWSRLTAFRKSELIDLYNNRDVVRLAMMRSTIHLVTSRDCLSLRPIVQPVIERGLRGSYAKFLNDSHHPEIEAAGRAFVDETPGTFSELSRRLSGRWPDRHAEAMSHLIRTRIPLVQVTPRGIWGATTNARHTSAESWLRSSLNDDASVTDRSAVISPRLDQRQSLMPRLGRAPVRFLPEFDNVLLAYRDRSRIIADKYKPRVYPNNGMIPPTVLVDGFVEGKWRITLTDKKASLSIEAFRRLTKAEKAEIEAEGVALLEFISENTESLDINIKAS